MIGAHSDVPSGLKFGVDHENNPRETVEALLKEAGLTLVELSLMEKGGKLGGLVEAVKR